MIFYHALMENLDLVEPNPIFIRLKDCSILFSVRVPDGEFAAQYHPDDKKWTLHWEDILV